jgi:hypothetical protein
VSDLANPEGTIQGLFANEKKINHWQEPGMKKADYYSISTPDNRVKP